MAIKQQRWNPGFFFRRITLYGLIAILVTIGYALLISGIGLIFYETSSFDQQPLLVGLAIFIIALLILPIRRALEKSIDQVFFRKEQEYQDYLQMFSGEITNTMELSHICRMLWQYVDRTLHPTSQHLFIYDPQKNQYTASLNPEGKPTTDIAFPAESPLVQKLRNETFPLIIPNLEKLPVELQKEQARLKLVGTTTFIPLPGGQQLSGWLALGSHISGEPFTQKEITYLESLCHQAALAIERSQVVTNLQNRVLQMNTLSRISEGVNVTLSLDDILELIYAQTTQIVPADDFQIVMRHKETGALFRIFNVQNDERLPHLENRFYSGEHTLDNEVIQSRRPILTEDYAKECQKLGILSPNTTIKAWMSVPLNAGAETIGVLSLGKRDNVTTYSNEQLHLMEAIADQAAGAIIKIRLLQETERRARQFSILNEVSRQLTSTLELEPLLRSILQSAVDILLCDAGSLLMVDEQTDELVFRVTVGPVASELLNQRLPPGTGVVGKSVTSREPIIVNNLQTAQDWYSRTDQETGFKTQGLLVIPLEVKEKVIGVIEVLNKKDGSPFNQDDQDLLQAFAAQAAIAIENARLYTMTDQELGARVEELSVMQRIDRELNTSLDTKQAMHITLEWAMRQSVAVAGLIGIIQDEKIQIVDSHGYSQELEPFKDSLLPIESFQLQDVIDQGTPQFRQIARDSKAGLLSTAQSQVIIPIRRESKSIGILLLESDTEGSTLADSMDFLERLSDHASIAISNAQLYAAVQGANVAKSEFVSFVSHELKNPMTSIKGYTELLAAGAVGPINEAQSNFLLTIKTNVERMATLVSDLADVSRIEAGRLRLEFKAVNLKDVVEEVARSLSRQIEEKKQSLSIQLAEDLSPIWADRMRIVQIATNLVSNAYKYTPAEGVIYLNAEVSSNIWDTNGAPKVVHIWVKDNGIGISPEDQKKIFQKFFRSEDSKAREAPGTGLGLNITKSLVEMQGGQIWFESVLRKGTTFHFTVPVAEQ